MLNLFGRHHCTLPAFFSCGVAYLCPDVSGYSSLCLSSHSIIGNNYEKWKRRWKQHTLPKTSRGWGPEQAYLHKGRHPE